jgi:hypothetical protein
MAVLYLLLGGLVEVDVAGAAPVPDERGVA